MSAVQALETAAPPAARARRAWSQAWPRLAAVLAVAAVWQLVVLGGFWPAYVLPPPLTVLAELRREAGTADFWGAIAITLTRAASGYAVAIVVGSVIGIAMARLRVLRAAGGSLITGLQTMPSIAWFPLAVLLFKLSESAILFVVVLGAAPSIANGFLSGLDHVPPEYLRAGRMLGARGLDLYRRIILPASLPFLVGGLKQGWAFAWRSLMAGELLVIVGGRPSIGVRLNYARDFSDAAALLATMVVILMIGIAVDSVFSGVDHRVRRNRGLLAQTAG